MSPSRTRSILFATAIMSLFALSVALQVGRDAVVAAGAPAVNVDYLYLPSGEVVDRFVLSFDMLAADVYWIRAIQHYGGEKRRTDSVRKYNALYPLLDIATTLDPNFTIAYRFGAIFLAEAYPGGPGRPDLAIRLLRKGLRATPRKWQYLQDIGFVHYWWRHDYRAAADSFARAAAIPGAPWWLEPLSATTLAQGGERGASRRLWEQLAHSADNAWLSNEAARRLQQLDALDLLDRVAAALDRYVRARGEIPRTWSEVTSAGYLRDLPRDPAGYALILDPATRTVHLSAQSPLYPLPAEPPALPAPDRPRGGD
jgi:hypothetical protein